MPSPYASQTNWKLPDKADVEHRLLYSTAQQRGSWKLLPQLKNSSFGRGYPEEVAGCL
jgi:hypothetical protein